MQIKNIRMPDGTPCESVMDAVQKFKCPGPCNPDCPLHPSVRLSGDTFGHMCHDEIVKRYPRSVLDAMKCAYDIHVADGGLDPTPDQRIRQDLYAAVIKSGAVRDVQFCETDNTDPLSDDWADLPECEIWLGFFHDPDALGQAARYAGTVPENIRLIPVDPNMEVARHDADQTGN